jgi:sodium/potassium/calcium exchanger 6
MLNILLGIGIGGFWMMIQDAKHNHLKHPDRPYRYKPYKISVEPTLMVSALFLLSTLAVLAIVVPMNKWMITKKLGLALIVLWAVGTAANVAVEMTGSWSYLY